MPRMVRTFIAVEIPDESRRRAGELIAALGRAPAKVKWVETHNLHLTLKFLGEVDPCRIHDICQAVAESVAEVPPFEFELRGAGAFPDAHRPRTVWLAVDRGREEMAVLHDCVEAALAKIGFREDGRRFEPHLTIGRVREGGPGIAELGRLLKQNADFLAGTATLSEVVVFSSELSRSGPTYEALGHAELLGR
ncbi:MAG: RNA 2',3'-cyclic phosphodiesterase [Pirellulales bacterium]